MYRWELWHSIRVGAAFGAWSATMAFSMADREVEGEIQALTPVDVWIPIYNHYPEAVMFMAACACLFVFAQRQLNLS